jgi:hypothetical protein
MRKGLNDAVLCLMIITAALLIINHRQSPTYVMALAQDVENNTIVVNNSKNSMLGELIYESSGKIVSQKS